MAIKYLTFDCYGTLIDWKAGIEESFRKYFALDIPEGNTKIFERYLALEMQEEDTYKPYSDVLRDTSTKLASSLGMDAPAGAGEKFAASITTWASFPDTAATLMRLGERGYKRVILSNIDRQLLEGTIANNNLEVDGFITAQDVKSYKPREGHWLEFLKRYNASRESTLHVANSIYHDIVPACRMKIKTAWVNRYGERLPDGAQPDYIASGLSGLLEILALA